MMNSFSFLRTISKIFNLINDDIYLLERLVNQNLYLKSYQHSTYKICKQIDNII